MGKRIRFCMGSLRLELCFAIIACSMFYSLFPGVVRRLMASALPENWTRSGAFPINIFCLVVLVAARFAPRTYGKWIVHRRRTADALEKHQHQLALKKERELLQRLKQGRERRIY